MSFASSLGAAITRYSLWDIATIVGGGIAVTAVGAFAVSIYGDIKSAGAAKVQIACVQGINASNETAYRELADTNHRAALAAGAARAEAEARAEAANERAVELQGELEHLKSNIKPGDPDPIVWPDAITRSLRK